jgi:hypothetical protein
MKLYAVLLGGSGGPGRLAEDHETVFVAAEDERSAKAAAKAKWSGSGRAHVDALSCVEAVDGFRIELRAGGPAAPARIVNYNDEPYDEG